MTSFGDGTRIMFAHVQMISGTYEWIDVRAAGLDEAREVAMQTPGVSRVLEVSYIPGGVVT